MTAPPDSPASAVAGGCSGWWWRQRPGGGTSQRRRRVACTVPRPPGRATPGRALAASLCSAALAGCGAAVAGTVAVVAGGHRIEAEVADTADSRATGLMYRTAMPADHGMLFVFPGDGHHCMWMRNTYLPLSVAFLDDQARVINVADMVPLTDTGHCAQRPARYALEMHAGWFARHGVVVGSRLQFRVALASW